MFAGSMEMVDLEQMLLGEDLKCTARHGPRPGQAPSPLDQCSGDVTWWRDGCRLHGPICENAAQTNFNMMANPRCHCTECGLLMQDCCAMRPL